MQEEELTEEVRKYPVVHDKSHKLPVKPNWKILYNCDKVSHILGLSIRICLPSIAPSTWVKFESSSNLEDIFSGALRLRSSRPEVFVREDVLKIYSRFTGEHPCRSAISILFYWNRISASVISCKFAVYFQKIFS